MMRSGPPGSELPPLNLNMFPAWSACFFYLPLLSRGCKSRLYLPCPRYVFLTISTRSIPNMITLMSPNFKLESVSEDDLILASLTWGFTIGVGALTAWTAIKQTVRLYQRRKGGGSKLATPYIIMIWVITRSTTIHNLLAS